MHILVLIDSRGHFSDCLDLISRLLEPDPGRRHAATQVIEHPWLASHTEKAIPT